MSIKIPVSYVPRAYVDYDAEARQILRQDFVLSDGYRVSPLTAGRLIALELVSSPFFLHPFDCDALDAAAALVLVSCSRELIPALTASASEPVHTVSGAGTAAETTAGEGSPSGLHGPSATYRNLYETAAKWFRAHGDAMLADYPKLVEWILAVPFYGLNMLPRGTAQPREFWFDGSFVGGIVAGAAKLLATPVDTVLWETPLCTVGHAIAQHAAACGVKGVERPPDEAVLDKMMREAAEREKHGELHPWQFDDPLTYNLTSIQSDANPDLIGTFAAMRAEFERNGHKPLDPASFATPASPVISKIEQTISVKASVLSASEAERTITVEEFSS